MNLHSFKIWSLGVVLLLLGCDAKIRIDPLNVSNNNDANLSDLTVTLVSTHSSPTNTAIPVTALFSKAPKTFSKNQIKVVNGTADSVTQVEPKLFSFLVQPQQEGLVEIQILADAVTDSTGRGFSVSNKLTFIFDETLPTLRDLTFASGGTSNDPKPSVNFRMSKPASVSLFLGACSAEFQISELEDRIGGGTLESIQVKQASAFTLDGSYPIMIQAQLGDKKGTCMKVGDYFYDTVKPTVTLSSSAVPLVNGPFQVIATFSKSVTGLDSGDIYVDGGTVPSAPTVIAGTNFTQYRFTIAPIAQGLITFRVAADAVLDSAGNKNGVSPDLTRNHDNIRPTVTLSSQSLDFVNAPFVVKAVFSESVTGLTLSDISVTGGSASNLSALPGTDSKEYEFTVSPSIEGDVITSIGLDSGFDSALNGNAVSNSLSRVHDTLSPTVSVTSSAATYLNGPFIAKAVFSEPVTGFSATGIDVVKATASNIVGDPATFVSGYGYREWSFTVTPSEEGQVSVSILSGAATDRVGNPNSASPIPVTRTYDVTRPNLSSITSTSPLLINQPFVIDLEFSEHMSSVVASDLTLSQGSASAPTEVPGSNGTRWQFTITPNQQGAISVGLVTNGPKDSAGNGLLATGQSVSRTFDTIRPSVTLSSQASPNLNASFTVIAEFSEVISGFALDDITVTKATLSNLQTLEADKKFEFTVTPNTEGTVSLTVNDSAAEDPTGNKSTASSAFTRVYDITRPSVALQSSATPNVNGPFTVVATFDEPMASFGLDALALTNGTASDLLQTSDQSWEFTLNPTLSGTVAVQVLAGKYSDLAGNLNTGSTELSRIFDISPPVISSITLNPSASPTTQTTLTVGFSVNELSTVQLHNGGACNSPISTASSLVTGAQSLTTNSLADGTYSVYIKAVDKAGNPTCELAKASHLVDTTAPQNGYLTISETSPTKSDTLSVAFGATDATAIEMQVSLNDLPSPTCSGTWEPLVGSKAITIPELLKNGTVNVDVRFRDAVLNQSSCIRASIVHDNTPPAKPTAVSINDGAVATNISTVNVKVTASDSPYQIALTQNADFCTNEAIPVSWVSFTGSPMEISYPLATNSLNTTTTIYARLRDLAGNISPCESDSITHSNTTPVNPGISIEGGAERTNKTQVTLTLSKTDTAQGISVEMYITNTAGCASGGSWVDFSPTTTFTLNPLNTTTSVYVKFRDKNTPAPGDPIFESSCAGDSIYHDNIAPLGTGIFINSGEPATPYPDIYITLSASQQEDPYMEYSMNLYESSDCTGTSLTNGWTGYYDYYYYYVQPNKQNTQLYFSVKFRDRTGNETACASKTILHDSLQPAIWSITKPAGPLSGGAAVTINGVNFRSGAQNSVEFNRLKATCSLVGSPVNGVYSQISCTVPAPSPAINSAQTVEVKITNPSTLFTTSNYTYQEAPTISSVATERNTATGLTRTSEKIILNGSFFRDSISITIDGNSVSDISVNSSSQVSFTTPAFNTIGSRPIVVTNTDGQSANSQLTFDERCSEKCGNASGSCFNQTNAIARSCATLEDGFEGSSPLYLDYVTRVPTVYINDNTKSTGSKEVTLTLSASYMKATEMYLSNTTDCSPGAGSWEPYALSKKWYLAGPQGSLQYVSVKFRDSNSETSCASDSIYWALTNPDLNTDDSQFRVWIEKNGQKILKASGLWADGWQYKLNPSGKGHNTGSGNEYLGDLTNLSNLGNRTNPPNVFLDDSNKFLTGRWIYYTQIFPPGSGPNGIKLSDGKLSSPAGEGIDWLKSWNEANTTNGASAAWYEGNINTCSNIGMRLPTLYEARISSPQTLNQSKLPLSDGTALFSSTVGLPATLYPMWTSTSDPSNLDTKDKFWYTIYNEDKTYSADPAPSESPLFKVRCVLP